MHITPDFWASQGTNFKAMKFRAHLSCFLAHLSSGLGTFGGLTANPGHAHGTCPEVPFFHISAPRVGRNGILPTSSLTSLVTLWEGDTKTTPQFHPAGTWDTELHMKHTQTME